MFDNAPVLAGAVALFSDAADPRRELLIGILILMAGLLILQGAHIDAGPIGPTITVAFTMMMGYWFGKKEEEIKTDVKK